MLVFGISSILFQFSVASTDQLNASPSPSSSKSAGTNNAASGGMNNDIPLNSDAGPLNGSMGQNLGQKPANLQISASMFDNSGHWSDFTSGPNSLDFLDDFDMDPHSFEDSFAGSGTSNPASLSINCPVYTNVSPPNSNNSGFVAPMANSSKAPMQSPQTVSSTDHLHPPPDYHSMMWGEYSGPRSAPPLAPNQGMLKELLNQDESAPITSSVYAGAGISKSVSPVKVKTDVPPTPVPAASGGGGGGGGGTKAKRQPKKPKMLEVRRCAMNVDCSQILRTKLN